MALECPGTVRVREGVAKGRGRFARRWRFVSRRRRSRPSAGTRLTGAALACARRRASREARRGGRSRAPLAAAAALAVLAAGCSQPGEAEPEELPTGQALWSPRAAHGGTTTTSGDIVMGTPFFTGMDRFAVEEPVVLEEVTPLRVDPGMEVLDVVVSFASREGEKGQHRFLLGDACLDRWPPLTELADPGAPVDPDTPAWLYPVEGLKLRAGDQILISLVTQPARAGHSSAEGLRIVYRRDGRRFQQTSEVHTVEFDAGDEGGCDGTGPGL